MTSKLFLEEEVNPHHGQDDTLRRTTKMPDDINSNLTIRPEQVNDYDAVFEINSQTFETEGEAKLVNALRNAKIDLIALVAELSGKAVGHILFSPVSIEHTASSIKVFGLGPMAISSDLQKKGIGSKLVQAGLKQCKQESVDAVFVLGYQEFYTKFGFQLARPLGFFFQDQKYDPYFMVVELTPDCLQNSSGEIFYHSLFKEVG